MNWKQITIGAVILGIIGVTAWYLIRQYKMIEDYCYKFASGKITFLALKRIDLRLKFFLKNNSDIDIQIISQNYQIYCNGVLVSNVNTTDYMNIPAHDWTMATINVTFNPLQVLQTALNNVADLLGNKENIKIDIEGYANAGSGGLVLRRLPIRYSTNLKELYEDDGEVDIEQISC